jgi:CBS domain-containing protein
MVTSTRDLIKILEQHPVRYWFKRGIKIRVMVPINVDNLETAKKLSKYTQIKHVDTVYARMAAVDDAHFFQFKAPPSPKDTDEPSAYFDHMLYTNDARYVEGMKKMLSDMWDTSLYISEIRSEAAARSPPVKVSPSDPASKIIDDMLENNIGSVIVTNDNRLVGIITEKDVLERVIKAKREPESTYAKEIMSTPVVAIDTDKPLIEAIEVMRNSKMRRLAVVREKNLVGILTERRAFEKLRIKPLSPLESQVFSQEI